MFCNLTLYLKFKRPVLNSFTTPLIITKKRPTFCCLTILYTSKINILLIEVWAKISEACLLKIVFFCTRTNDKDYIFVVDILREYAHSRKFRRWYNAVHWSTY